MSGLPSEFMGLGDLTGLSDAGGSTLAIANSRGRYTLVEEFRRRIATSTELDYSAFDTQAKMRLYLAAHKDWLVSGTNATAALCTFHVNGGVTLTTAGASADQMIVSPLVVNSVEQTTWGATSWTPERQPSLELTFITGASVADVRFILGFKLTAAEEDHDAGATITDDDYALAVFDTTHAASATVLHAATGNTGTDENSGAVANVAEATLKASTRYRLTIALDTDRRPSYAINGQQFAIGQAMRTGLALRPVFGIRALTNSAKSITLQKLLVSQNL